MATPERRLERTAAPLHQPFPNDQVQSEHSTGPTELNTESWVWKAYGVRSLDELKQKYGVDELQGVSADEAARVWEDIQINGTVPLATVKRELGLDGHQL